MPILTARSFSEMMHLPGYEQQRILHEQKYPKQGPSIFKVPYYIPALGQIKLFYSSSNNRFGIQNWIATSAPSIRPDAKRVNNIRVLMSFLQSQNATRSLVPSRFQKSFRASPHANVELKLSFDLCVTENGTEKFVLINPRGTASGQQIAEDTLQVAYWVMTNAGSTASISDLEYWDLPSQTVYIARRVMKRTITNMLNNALIVDALWNSI